MAWVEVDAEGEAVNNEEGVQNSVETLDMGGWDHVKGQIPEDLQGEKIWDNVPDTPTLLKNYAHAQKKMGGSITLPSDQSTPEDWDDIFTKLGRPETSEEYGDVFGEAPAGGEWDQQVQSSFLNAAHKAGLNPQQTQVLTKWYTDWQRDIGITGDRIMGEAESTLRGEWGPNYEANIALATRAAKKMGGQEFLDLMDSTGLGNHPEVIKTWVQVGRVLAEDNIIPAEVEGAATSVQAKSKIAEIQSDAEHPYHKGDKAAGEEMRKLFQIAYPDMK